MTATSTPGGRLAANRIVGHLAARPVVAVSWAVVALVLLSAVFAPVLAPFHPIEPAGSDRMLSPGSPGHLLGTDQFGRDVLSRIFWGARPVVIISLAAVVLAVGSGFAIGLVAGYLGGWADMVLMRLMDVVLAFPLILLAIVIVAALGPGMINVIIAIAVSQVPIFARLVRALAAREARKDYVLAAQAGGFRSLRIMTREIAPNVVGPVIVQASSTVAVAALFSAALSYLGLGIQPPTPDWGYMVKEGQELLFLSPSAALVPGIFIAVFVTAWNFIGDDLRDVLAVEEVR